MLSGCEAPPVFELPNDANASERIGHCDLVRFGLSADEASSHLRSS